MSSFGKVYAATVINPTYARAIALRMLGAKYSMMIEEDILYASNDFQSMMLQKVRHFSIWVYTVNYLAYEAREETAFGLPIEFEEVTGVGMSIPDSGERKLSTCTILWRLGLGDKMEGDPNFWEILHGMEDKLPDEIYSALRAGNLFYHLEQAIADIRKHPLVRDKKGWVTIRALKAATSELLSEAVRALVKK